MPAARDAWHRVRVNELRKLRRDAHLTQHELADLLAIPVNTLRMWDSGLRRPPAHVLVHARDALTVRARRRQLLSLADLAKELGVHVRTLRIGAAGKAVVYQWESRKRTPSSVLWQRVLELERQPARR